MMEGLEIVERKDDEVLWRYRGQDGTSTVVNDVALRSCLCEDYFRLPRHIENEITRQVNFNLRGCDA